jgi:hypothetical protein
MKKLLWNWRGIYARCASYHLACLKLWVMCIHATQNFSNSVVFLLAAPSLVLETRTFAR